MQTLPEMVMEGTAPCWEKYLYQEKAYPKKLDLSGSFTRKRYTGIVNPNVEILDIATVLARADINYTPEEYPAEQPYIDNRLIPHMRTTKLPFPVIEIYTRDAVDNQRPHLSSGKRPFTDIHIIDGAHRIVALKKMGINEIPFIVYREPGGNLMVKEGTTPAPEPANKEFKANPSLINKSAAQSAYRGTSFEPEKRGEEAIRGFAEEVQAVYERLKPHARTDAEKALLIAEMERFQASYAQKYNDLLYAHSRIYSTMIAGPSGFPTERIRKINEAYDNKSREMYEWKDRAEKAMLRALKGLATEEAGGEVAVIKAKIAQAEKLQEMMKVSNTILRKKIPDEAKVQEIIKATGFQETTVRKLLIPDYMGRIGFPAFELTNNNARIKSMKIRITELEKKEATPSGDIAFEGGKIVDNREQDRIQIFFNTIPSEELRGKLKSEGWHWSPSIGAWQRKRTDMALFSARRILGLEAQKPVFVPAKEEPKIDEEVHARIQKVIDIMKIYRDKGATYEDFLAGLKGYYLEQSGYVMGSNLDVQKLIDDLKKSGYNNLRELWRKIIIQAPETPAALPLKLPMLYPASQPQVIPTEPAYIPKVGDMVRVIKPWGSLTTEDVLEVVDVNELFDAQLIKRISPREIEKYGMTRATNLIPVKRAGEVAQAQAEPELKWVYGTQSGVWHLVGPEDRDYVHGITQERMKIIGQEAAKAEYLNPSLARAAAAAPEQAPRDITWRKFPDHKSETKAVKDALEKAGIKAEVGHGTGTAWGWLEINIGDPRLRGGLKAPPLQYQYTDEEMTLQKKVLKIAQEVTGRRGEYEGNISILAQEWRHKAEPAKVAPAVPAPIRSAEEIMFVPNPETLTKEEFIKEKYKRMAQVLRQQGKNAIAERIEKGARDPDRTLKYETFHRDQVVLALAQGKTVGGDVLKDYPDIVARIRKENEAIYAKERAERERIKAIERAEENELNAELNKLPPSLKRHAETEIYSTLHLPETHKDYRNRFYIALGKVRRIAFTHLPREKELQPPVQPQVLPEVRKEEPVEPLSPEYERVLKAYLENRGHELKLQDFIWADKYTIRGTAKYAIRTMEEKRRREEFILKNYNEDIGKKVHRGTVISALQRGLKVPDDVLKDYPDLMEKEVPEPTGYFSLKKAQELIRENNSKLSYEELHKKSIQLRDYIRFIETPDEYSRKTLVKGGYYAGVIDQFVTGVVPVDPWLHQNLKSTLDEVDKELQHRKQEKEKISVPTVPVAKPVTGKFVQTTFQVEERMRRYGYA